MQRDTYTLVLWENGGRQGGGEGQEGGITYLLINAAQRRGRGDCYAGGGAASEVRCLAVGEFLASFCPSLPFSTQPPPSFLDGRSPLLFSSPTLVPSSVGLPSTLDMRSWMRYLTHDIPFRPLWPSASYEEDSSTTDLQGLDHIECAKWSHLVGQSWWLRKSVGRGRKGESSRKLLQKGQEK